MEEDHLLVIIFSCVSIGYNTIYPQDIVTKLWVYCVYLQDSNITQKKKLWFGTQKTPLKQI